MSKYTIVSIFAGLFALIAGIFLGRYSANRRRVQDLKDRVDTGTEGARDSIERADEVEGSLERASDAVERASEHLDNAESILDAAEKRAADKRP